MLMIEDFFLMPGVPFSAKMYYLLRIADLSLYSGVVTVSGDGLFHEVLIFNSFIFSNF
jgi:hypothetical protein